METPKPRYQTFLGFVNAIQKLNNTTAIWKGLSDEEQEELSELSAALSNSIGELQNISPKRWGDKNKKPGQ